MKIDREIVLAGIALLTVVAGGAWFSFKKSKNRTSTTNQSNIKMKGNGNKVVGGDDNSSS
jgi:hypothetical protein